MLHIDFILRCTEVKTSVSTKEQQRFHYLKVCYRFPSNILDLSVGVGGVHILVIISTRIPHQAICVMILVQIKFGE